MKRLFSLLLVIVLMLPLLPSYAEVFTPYGISFDMTIDQAETYLKKNLNLPVQRFGTAILRSTSGSNSTLYGIPCDITFMVSSFNTYYEMESNNTKKNISYITELYQTIIPGLVKEYTIPNTFVIELFSDGLSEWYLENKKPMYYSAKEITFETLDDLFDFDPAAYALSWNHYKKDTDMSILVFIENIAVRATYTASTGDISFRVTFHSSEDRAQTDVKTGDFTYQ